MQKITSHAKQSRSAVLVAMASKLPFLMNVRASAISHMSGYPVPRHALARLQRMLDFSSVNALLNSIIKLYELTYLTAEVIESMDATNLNKYQINRVEVAAYIANMLNDSKTLRPTEEDIDVIAHIITSSEANPNAWTLAGASDDDNIHLKFYELYQSVIMADEPTSLPIYAPHSGTIIPLSQLPLFRKRAEDKTGEEADAEATKMKNYAVIYQFALTRVLDHVYQLMMDKDVWYQFLSPRKTADVTSNLDRARSLRVFSLYLQSLLTYQQFFGLEMYLGAYDLIQQWIAAFPSLETETINKIEATIRKHDYLGAKHDASRLLKSFAKHAESDLGSIVFPREYVDTFGFAKKVDAIENIVREIPIPGTIAELPILDNPKFLPLTAGGMVSDFDIMYNLADLLVREKVVAGVIDEALKGLIPSITRGSSKMALSGLEALQISCSIPFEIPAAVTFEVAKGVAQELRGGTLYLDSAAAPFSTAYHRMLRDDLRFRLLYDRQMISDSEPNRHAFAIDHDRATRLRSILDYEWKSLVPSTMAVGERTITAASVGISIDTVKELVEYVTGLDYEIAIRQLSVPEMRKVWSTFTSAFCLTYRIIDDARELRDVHTSYDPAVDNARVVLVEGYGKPFGTTYPSLESKQGALSDTDRLIPLGRGLFIRFLTNLPIPTTELRFDTESLVQKKPFSYFAPNSATFSPKEWVRTEGMWHQALFPIRGTSAVPMVKFTPKYAFANANIYLNMNVFYKPTTSEPARETASLPLVKEEWSLDRFQFWAEFIHFGKYAKIGTSEAPQSDTELLADTIKKIEKQSDADAKTASDINQKAGTAMKETVSKVASEVDQLKSNKVENDLGADEATPRI